jgi:hypothetical protein
MNRLLLAVLYESQASEMPKPDTAGNREKAGKYRCCQMTFCRMFGNKFSFLVPTARYNYYKRRCASPVVFP